MKSVLIRVIISLFLCCCLVLNVVSISAKAVGVDWILGQIATDIGVTGILEGLGLFRDTLNGDEYYNNLVSDVKDHLASSGQFAGDVMDIWWRIDPLSQNSVLTIPLALITAVRNYIFDNGVVQSSPYSLSVYGVDFSSDSFLNVIYFQRYSSGKYTRTAAVYSSSAISSSVPGYPSGSVVVDGTTYYWRQATLGSGYEYDETMITGFPSDSNVQSYISSNGYKGVSSYNPIILGTIAPPGTLFTSAYPQWLEHEKEEEDGSTVPMVQIGLGNTVGETESLTQEQIWSGQGTVPVPGQDVTDASLTDILQSIVALPAQMVVSITDALSTFFTPSGTIEAYSLDLKDLFPFCIPFDIFDFLAALSADPVPPVFEFDLNLGVATEPMRIDLSNWSDLAAIIRTLELGLFCVGLALKTRELIGG